VTENFSANAITNLHRIELEAVRGQATGSASSVTFGNIYNTGNDSNLQFLWPAHMHCLHYRRTNGYLGTIYAPSLALTLNNGSNTTFGLSRRLRSRIHSR